MSAPNLPAMSDSEFLTAKEKTMSVKKHVVYPRKKITVSKETPKLWDLYRDGLTQSALRLFLDCPHQFWLTYVQGWVNKASSTALEFGIAFHEIEAKICDVMDKHPNKCLDFVILDLCGQYIEQRLQEGKLLGIDAETLEETIGLVEVTLPGYFQQWERERPVWVCREKVFNVPTPILPSLQGTLSNDYPIPLQGRWDGLLRNKKGNLCLLETKTKARIDEEGLQAMLPFDFQTMLYCWAAREQYKEEIFTIIYNVIRKTQLSRRKGESLKDYLDKIKNDIESRPGFYYMRWQVNLTSKTIDNWVVKTLRPALLRIKEWWESVKDKKDPFLSPLHYMNSDALMTHYGTRSNLFRMITVGDTFGYSKRTVPFPELVD